MATTTLDSLPEELLELTVVHLDLQTIRDLRLVSRTVARKITKGRFRSFFRSKHIDLTRTDLEAFAHVTSTGDRVGCLVEDLTITGVVFDPLALEEILRTGEKYAREDAEDDQSDEIPFACSAEELQWTESQLETMRRRRTDFDELHKQGAEVRLLTEAFSAIVSSGRSALRRLSLGIVVFREDGETRTPPVDGQCWKWIFQAAAATFLLAVTCLRNSQLSVEAFDVYSAKSTSPGCHLPCDTLGKFDWNAPDSRSCFKRLRFLRLRICDRIVDETEYHVQSCGDSAQEVDLSLLGQKRDQDLLRSEITQAENFDGLHGMISACPELEALDISCFSLTRSNDDLRDLQTSSRYQHVHGLAKLAPFSRLRTLRLAGLNFHGSDMLDIVTKQKDSLREIALVNVYCGKDCFAPILACLTNDAAGLENVHLEDLWEDDKLVQFCGEKEQSHTRISGDHLGRNVLLYSGVDTRKHIVHQVYDGIAIGSPAVRRWRARTKIEFGDW